MTKYARQRAPRDAHLVHERDREPLRARRRRRRRTCGAASATTGASATTSSFPASATAARASRRTCRRSSAPRTSTGMEFPLLNAVEDVNERAEAAPGREGRRRSSATTLSGRRFAIWGLAFKPRTDDMREAPSIVIIEGCSSAAREHRGARPRGARRGAARSSATASPTTASTTTRSPGADALLIVTEWNEFRRPDFARMKQLMQPPDHLRRPQPLRARTSCASTGFTLRPDRPRGRARPSGEAGAWARILITGGAGFIGSHLCERFLADGDDVICMDNFLTGSPDNIAHLLGNPRFTFIQQDVTNYVYVDGHARRDPALRVAREPDRLPRAADPDAQGRLARHAQGARPRQGEGRALPARVDLRGLRRPARPPAERGLLGQRQPDRPARRLRRGQALRRSHDHGLPPLPRRRDAHRPHLQHLRPAHAAATTAASCRTSSRRRCAARPITVYGDGVADAELLLRRPTWSKASCASCARTTTDPVNVGNPRRDDRSCSSPSASSALTGSKSEIVYQPLPVDDPKVRQPDITLARRVLNDWQPVVSRRGRSEAHDRRTSRQDARTRTAVKILVTGGAGFIARTSSDAYIAARPRGRHRRRPLDRQAREPAPRPRSSITPTSARPRRARSSGTSVRRCCRTTPRRWTSGSRSPIPPSTRA